MRARPVHRGAVALECAVEVGRAVLLDVREDCRFARVGVDLARRRDAGVLLLGQLLPAELEDLVGFEAVERTVGDQRIVPLPTDRPLVGAVRERALEPGAVELDGDLGALRCTLQPTLFGRGEGSRPGGHQLVEQGGQLGRRLDLDLLPAPDLRDGRAGLRTLEVLGHRLESPRDGRQPLRERGEVTGEQQEQPVPDRVHRERAALPDTQDLGIEDGPADVVQLEIALEPGGRREIGRVDRLDRGEVRLVVVDVGEQRVAAAVTQLVVGVVQAKPGREHGLALDHATEAGLDQVVQARVGGTGVGLGRWSRKWSVVDAAGFGHDGPRLGTRGRARGCVSGGVGGRGRAIGGRVTDQAEAPTGSGATGRGSVSARAARVAAMVVSMSSAVTP